MEKKVLKAGKKYQAALRAQKLDASKKTEGSWITLTKPNPMKKKLNASKNTKPNPMKKKLNASKGNWITLPAPAKKTRKLNSNKAPRKLNANFVEEGINDMAVAECPSCGLIQALNAVGPTQGVEAAIFNIPSTDDFTPERLKLAYYDSEENCYVLVNVDPIENCQIYPTLDGLMTAVQGANVAGTDEVLEDEFATPVANPEAEGTLTDPVVVDALAVEPDFDDFDNF